MIVFEWDDNKNRINIVKHGVSFEDNAYKRRLKNE